MERRVRSSRRAHPHGSIVNALWSATPCATMGWAICSRMARPQPASSTRSRWILHVTAACARPSTRLADCRDGMSALCRAGETSGARRPLCGRHPSLRKGERDRRTVPYLATALLLAGLVLPAAALEVGQRAPDFTLPAPGGKQVKLSDLTAKGPVVIFTFIQAFTDT